MSETLNEAAHDRQPTIRQYARMVVCFHEAGHAVALWEAGIAVDALTIQQGWFSASAAGRTHVKSGQYYDYEDEEGMVSALAGILAGRVAHERFEIEYGVSMETAPVLEGTSSEMRSYGLDAQAAAISAEAGCGSDMADFHEIAPHVGVSYSFVLQRTEALIDAKWPRVIQVANLLYERGRVSGGVAR